MSARFDPDGLLLDIAAGPAGELSGADLAEARRLLQRPGGLAYSYQLLDDLALLARAAGVPERASLLDELLADLDEQPLVPAHALRRIGAGAAFAVLAASLLLFIKPDEPGVKSLPGLHEPVRVVGVQVEGPLSEDAVRRGLAIKVRPLLRCTDDETTLRVSLLISSHGIVEQVSIDSVQIERLLDADAEEAVGRCVRDVLAKASFDFHRASSRASVTLTLAPEMP